MNSFELHETFHHVICFLLIMIYFKVFLSAVGGTFKVQSSQLGSSILNVQQFLQTSLQVYLRVNSTTMIQSSFLQYMASNNRNEIQQWLKQQQKVRIRTPSTNCRTAYREVEISVTRCPTFTRLFWNHETHLHLNGTSGHITQASQVGQTRPNKKKLSRWKLIGGREKEHVLVEETSI